MNPTPSTLTAEETTPAKNVATSSLWAFERSIDKGRGCHSTRLGSWRRGVNYAGFDLTHSFHGFCFVVAFGRHTWFKGRATPATHASNLQQTEARGNTERDAWPFDTVFVGKGSSEGSGKRRAIGGEEGSRK